MLLFALLTAIANPLDPSVGVFAGAHIASPEHELYRSPGKVHGPLGPSVPVGLRLGVRLFGPLDLEGEAFAGPATQVGGGVIYGVRGQLSLRGPTLLTAFRPLAVVGGGNLGLMSNRLGNDVDLAAHLGPAVEFPFTRRLAVRADLRWLLSRRFGPDRAPASHGEALLSVQWRDDERSDRDADGVLDREDLCPKVPEFVKNGWMDDDGCPDRLANLLIRVKDAEDRLLRDTEIFDGETSIATTNRDGNVHVEGLMPERVLMLRADSPEHVPGATEVRLVEGENLAVVTLGWAPGTVLVTAKQRDGTPIAANVWAIGPKNTRWDLDETGSSQKVLQPGPWTVMVVAEGYDAVTKQVVLPNDVGARTHVNVTLHTQRVGLQGDEIVTLDNILFEYDAIAVRGESLSILDAVAVTLRNNPDIRLLEVSGHASADGEAAYNMALSQRRVEEVVHLLTQRGIDRARLEPIGYGETRPAASNTARSGRRANRRVEFLVRVRAE